MRSFPFLDFTTSLDCEEHHGCVYIRDKGIPFGFLRAAPAPIGPLNQDFLLSSPAPSKLEPLSPPRYDLRSSKIRKRRRRRNDRSGVCTACDRNQSRKTSELNPNPYYIADKLGGRGLRGNPKEKERQKTEKGIDHP